MTTRHRRLPELSDRSVDLDEFLRRFPERDWFPRRHWRDSVLYQRAPDVVERAMLALHQLVPSERFMELMLDGGSYHPLRLGLVDAAWISFWPAFKIGHALAVLEGTVPASLLPRLLDPSEVRGAQSELNAAAALRSEGVRFRWFPVEGGEFGIVDDDSIRFVEVKNPQDESERTRREMDALWMIRRRLMDVFPTFVIATALRPDFADGFTNRQRNEIPWAQIVDAFVAMGRGLVADGVPGRREGNVGTIWLANTEAEMAAMGSGGDGGMFLNGDYESDRVLRSVVRRAAGQLPKNELSVISIDWNSPPTEFFAAVERRLVGTAYAAIAGVIVRERMFFSGDAVPRFTSTFIENPQHQGITDGSRVRKALEADDMLALRAEERD
jgi:hypothetical protein